MGDSRGGKKEKPSPLEKRSLVRVARAEESSDPTGKDRKEDRGESSLI